MYKADHGKDIVIWINMVKIPLRSDKRFKVMQKLCQVFKCMWHVKLDFHLLTYKLKTGIAPGTFSSKLEFFKYDVTWEESIVIYFVVVRWPL